MISVLSDSCLIAEERRGGGGGFKSRPPVNEQHLQLQNLNNVCKAKAMILVKSVSTFY